MTFMLNRPFAADRAVEEEDVRAVKRALNRLGYYTPYPKIGMNEFTDSRVFAALKEFQKDHGLFVNGAIRPKDDTETALNAALEAAGEKGRYIWHSVEDDHVRADHAARHGQVFSWDDHPQPGEEFGCRCWAEPIKDDPDLSGIYDPPIEPVYPEVLLVPALRLGKGLVGVRSIIAQILNRKDTLWVAGISKERLQHTFKHSKSFGINENMNTQSLEKLRLAIQKHADDPQTLVIKGTYHKNPVSHYFNTRTGINVIQGKSGDLISFWKLSDSQIYHILRNGKLGGN